MQPFFTDEEESLNGEIGEEERLNCFELMSLLHLQDNQELWRRICEAVLVKLFGTGKV